MHKIHSILMLALAVLAATLLLACGDSIGESAIVDPDYDSENQKAPAADQEVLFEVSYTNFAWGYRLSGLYIDRRGDVFSFSRGPEDERWNPADWDHVYEPDLRDKYSLNKDRIGTIDRVTITNMIDLIGEASVGEMTEKVNRCADFGGRSFVAFAQDDATGEYASITLYQYGDWAQRNKSSAAMVLFEWLRDVAGESGEILCGCEE